MATPITASHEDEEKTAPPSSPLTPSHTKEEVVDACQGLLIMAGLCRTTSSGSTSCGTPMTSPPRPRSYFDHSPWDMFYNDTTPHWGLPSLNPLGRVGSMILDHPAPNIAPYPLSGVTFVMFDVRGYASEYVPVFVTAVHQRDPQRSPYTSHAADIQYGEGVLMVNLLSASVCGHRTVGLHCRFHYDGSTYLVADNPMDFVWVPADHFRRTRPPFIGDACPELEGRYRTAYEYFSQRFMEYLEEYFKEEDEHKHECQKHGPLSPKTTSPPPQVEEGGGAAAPKAVLLQQQLQQQQQEDEHQSLPIPTCRCEFHS